MENLHLSVIPAQAGIHWLQVLRDPCFRRDDGEEALFDTLFFHKAILRCHKINTINIYVDFTREDIGQEIPKNVSWRNKGFVPGTCTT